MMVPLRDEMRTGLFYTIMFKSNIEYNGYKINMVQKLVKVFSINKMHRVIMNYV